MRNRPIFCRPTQSAQLGRFYFRRQKSDDFPAKLATDWSTAFVDKMEWTWDDQGALTLIHFLWIKSVFMEYHILGAERRCRKRSVVEFMQESIVFLVRVQCRRKESSRSLSHLMRWDSERELLEFLVYNYKPNIICVMYCESWHYMPHKWISRFPLITLYKRHHMLFLNKWNINLCKKYSISKYTLCYGSFAPNSEVCFLQEF